MESSSSLPHYFSIGPFTFHLDHFKDGKGAPYGCQLHLDSNHQSLLLDTNKTFRTTQNAEEYVCRQLKTLVRLLLKDLKEHNDRVLLPKEKDHSAV